VKFGENYMAKNAENINRLSPVRIEFFHKPVFSDGVVRIWSGQLLMLPPRRRPDKESEEYDDKNGGKFGRSLHGTETV